MIWLPCAMERTALLVMALLLLAAGLVTGRALLVAMARMETCVAVVMEHRAGLAAREATAICEGRQRR